MFCKNCGSQIDDNAVVCPHCGVQVANIKDKKTNTMSIVGFVLSFLIPIAGLICSIIARKKCREEGLGGDGLALAGIIISAVSMALSLLAIIIYISMIGSYYSMIDSLYNSISTIALG